MNRSNNSQEYILLREATKYCSYSQEYLSLRARQGKLKAVKFGKTWMTKKEWLREYIRDVRRYKKETLDHQQKQSKQRFLDSKTEPLAPFTPLEMRFLTWLRDKSLIGFVVEKTKLTPKPGLVIGLAFLIILSSTIFIQPSLLKEGVNLFRDGVVQGEREILVFKDSLKLLGPLMASFKDTVFTSLSSFKLPESIGVDYQKISTSRFLAELSSAAVKDNLYDYFYWLKDGLKNALQGIVSSLSFKNL